MCKDGGKGGYRSHFTGNKTKIKQNFTVHEKNKRECSGKSRFRVSTGITIHEGKNSRLWVKKIPFKWMHLYKGNL